MDIICRIRIPSIHYDSWTCGRVETLGASRIRSRRRRASIVSFPWDLHGNQAEDNGSIYLVRLGLSTYYDYRTSNIQSHLNELQTQRDATIEKLKAATKYNSTQELLKKYGGIPTPKAKPVGGSDRKVPPQQEGTPRSSRTSFIPPPTANIPGRDGLPPLQTTSQRPTPQVRGPLEQSSPISGMPSPQRPTSPNDPSAEFAPNAFSAPAQYAQANEGSRWYDRIMDVLLGDDETRAGSRLALICNNCRLVNGQAPPGVKRLVDLGKWRCGGCGTINGEETEAKKMVASLKEQASQQTQYSGKGKDDGRISESSKKDDDDAASASTNDGHESDVTQYSTEESGKDEEKKEMAEVRKSVSKPVAEPDPPRRRSTRPTKGKRT